MLSPAKQKKIRIYLYMVVLSSQTAYYIIITLLPFLNESLKTTDFQYSIAFSGYYFTVLLSSLFFGPISDRIGRRKAIVISLAILVASHVVMFWTRNITVYLVSRIVAGLFDTVQYLSQAVIADITTNRDRAKYLAQLESVVNVSQMMGPLLGGVLSSFNLYIPLWLSVALYGFALFISTFFLPESISSVVEKNELLASFELVEQTNKSNNVSLLDYEESKKIQKEFMATLHKQEVDRQNSSKLHFNYLMIIGFIGEFCNRWTYGVFDTVVSIYGLQHFGIQSLPFSLISTFGSVFNIFQTGWLFSFLIRHDFSIPIITCCGGIVSTIAMICCLSGTKTIFIVGSILIIVAYGFASPTSPAIMSAECGENNQGKAVSITLIGGQCAYILGPLVLNNIYPHDNRMPFYVSMLPSIVLFLSMFICNYLPGGRLAGQVSLADSLQNDMELKIARMEGTLDKKIGDNDKRLF
ncbi:hypothetical protein WA538_004586 [Blastocystis sp. DL]